MHIEDASDKGKVTDNNQLAGQKDKRAMQHKRQRNDSNRDNDNGNGDSSDNKNDINTLAAVASIKG
jgi:hypothetical protein